jgi:dTDP-4-amino-4,6-dideoxygalactose transaminase
LGGLPEVGKRQRSEIRNQKSEEKHIQGKSNWGNFQRSEKDRGRRSEIRSQKKNTYKARAIGGTSRGQKSEDRGQVRTEVGDQKSEVRRKTHTRQEQLGGLPEVRGQEGKQRFQARMVGGKVSEDLFERGLCLPSGTAMTDGDLDWVVKVIRGCRK